MSLRLLWEQEDETPQLLELALIDRYDAAYSALASGSWETAIYLFGYVAEMVLKTAYFRVQGNSLSGSVSAMLPAARQAGAQRIPLIPHESYHSLRFWSELLLATRRQQGRALAVGTELELQYYSRILYMNWMVEMRYHPNRANETEAMEVAEAATWLFNNRSELGT